jgi:hypothetical protein
MEMPDFIWRSSHAKLLSSTGRCPVRAKVIGRFIEFFIDGWRGLIKILHRSWCKETISPQLTD